MIHAREQPPLYSRGRARRRRPGFAQHQVHRDERLALRGEQQEPGAQPVNQLCIAVDQQQVRAGQLAAEIGERVRHHRGAAFAARQAPFRLEPFEVGQYPHDVGSKL